MKKVILAILLVFVAFQVRATTKKVESDSGLVKLFQEVLGNYPELKSVSVEMVFTEKKRHMMWARPTIKSFFKKKLKYRVFVSTDTMYENFLDTLSVDAKIGWFAHELGHMVDYEKQGKLATMWMGVQYFFFPKGRKRIEERADKIAVEHNYGCELLCSIDVSKKHLPAWKQKQIERFYLKKAQLEKLIEECRKK